jgi:hypothetical protein
MQPKAKITKDNRTGMFQVWILKNSHTGIKCLDSNPTWRVSQAFFTMSDAIIYQQSI